MRKTAFPCRFVPIACLALFVAAAPTRAEILESNLQEWKTQYDKEARDLVELQLAPGKIAILAEHQPRIELAAKYYTAQIKFLKPDKGADIQGWFQKMDTLLKKGKDGEFHQAFLKIFAAESARWAADILDNPAPNSTFNNQVNVLRYLAMLADYGQEGVVPVLLKVLSPKAEGTKYYNEGARYYAAKALQSFFAQAHRADKPIPIQDKKLEADVVARLVEQLNNPEHVSDDAPEERLDGFRVLRREIIRALGQARLPVVKGENGNVPVALELGKIVYASSGVSPPPRLDERVDAVIGLTQMDSAASPDFQPDYAAYWIGKFVNVFALRYRTQKPDKKVLVDSFDSLALKLAEALAKLRDSKQATEYQKKVATLAVDVLTNLDGNKGNPAELDRFLDDPTNTIAQSFYKDAKDAVLSGDSLPIKLPGEK
jgi:hypothetical protein